MSGIQINGMFVSWTVSPSNQSVLFDPKRPAFLTIIGCTDRCKRVEEAAEEAYCAERKTQIAIAMCMRGAQLQILCPPVELHVSLQSSMQAGVEHFHAGTGLHSERI